MSDLVQDDRDDPPPVDMDALRVIYQAAGKLRLDPDLFPPPAFGLEEAVRRLAGRADREREPLNRRALYMSALGYLAGEDAKLPLADDLVTAYRDYAASLAPEGLGDRFRALVADDGTFEPKKVVSGQGDDDAPFRLRVAELLELYDGDVCNIALAAVGGKPAVAIYSELTTHKPFAGLDEWVNPKQWATWGPALFKQMQVHVPPPEQAVLPPPGIEGYTATFLEHVDLFGHDLQNQLACAFSRGDAVVAMTYDLVQSRDDEVTVDRGFVSATAVDAQRSRLRVLKIIGFSDAGLQDAMLLSCPLWTDFIRFAAENAEDIVSGHEVAPTTMLDVLCGMLRDDWVQLVSSTATTYSQLAVDIWQQAPTAWSTPGAVVASGRQVVHQLVQDWAKLWQTGNQLVGNLAGTAGAAAPSPPGGAGLAPAAPVAAGRNTTASGKGSGASVVISVTVPASVGTVTLSAQGDLLGIDGSRAFIPAAALTLSPVSLAAGESHDVTVALRVPCDQIGLYVGALDVGGGASVPFGLYVSGAERLGP